jgi:4-aminobutyrate aminotransferase-like enzyme
MNTTDYRNAYPDLFTPSLKKATDLIIDRAEGPYLFTMEGDRYLDLVQGIAVNPLGHCHPALVNASVEQIKRMGHVSFNLASYPGALNLATKLRSLMPSGIDTFFFTNSGAEAVEAAIKLARYVTGKGSIIAFRGSFHGRTMGAASVTSSNLFASVTHHSCHRSTSPPIQIVSAAFLSSDPRPVICSVLNISSRI